MSDFYDARVALLATMARQLGCFELALAYEETRYLGEGGRLMRGNLEERAAELGVLYDALKSGRFG